MTGVLDQSLLFGKIVRASFFFHVQVEGFWCLILSLLLNHEPHSVFTWNSLSSMAAAVCHSPFSINNWLGVSQPLQSKLLTLGSDHWPRKFPGIVSGHLCPGLVSRDNIVKSKISCYLAIIQITICSNYETCSLTSSVHGCGHVCLFF